MTNKCVLFLDEANEDRFLQTIREKSAPLRAVPDEDESGDDSDSDVLSGEDELGDDELEEYLEEEKVPLPKKKKSKKKPERRNCKELEALIKKYDPSLECGSDTNCLLTYTDNSIKFLHVTYGQNPEDLTEWVKQLRKIAKIITAMYSSNTDTLRNRFVDYTGIFKGFI
jgi:hypothetical protein